MRRWQRGQGGMGRVAAGRVSSRGRQGRAPFKAWAWAALSIWVACAGGPAAAQAPAPEAGALKPGRWVLEGGMQLQTHSTTFDLKTVYAQLQTQIAGLPPEARESMAENLRHAGIELSGGGRSQELCVPPAMASLARLAVRQLPEDCQYQMQQQTGRQIQGTLRCTRPDSEGRFTATWLDAERISTRSETRNAQGQRVLNATARWVGADCGNAPRLAFEGMQQRSLFGPGAAPAAPPSAAPPGGATSVPAGPPLRR